ncbi:MAG: pirin family protein [Rhodoferax sp.]|nr:pirin family protein [Rhodoferax sp.]MCF8209466.1 pirin family protein [Rhodoferax sp.]
MSKILADSRVPTVRKSRGVEQLISGQATSDGAGVKLTRVLTQNLQHRLDPYLMLDAFGSDNPDDYIAGFPDHPHRGFETVTYMIAGRMLHRDSAGHEGLLENGGVQWMVAGRGLIHSEIPQQERGVMEGFQLWLNLPRTQKLRAPWYQDYQNADLPQFRTAQDIAVTVIAGSSHGVAGAVQRDTTEPLYLDIHLPAGSTFVQDIPSSHNAFVYVYRGEVAINEQAVPVQRMAILETNRDADGVVISASGESRILLISGKPLNEPIVQYGPFVMNSKEEIYQAVRDYQQGQLEKAPA